MATRSPIVSVLGHVDHGKSSILDSFRGSNIVAGEAGAITQAIGASIMPLHIIQKKCGALLQSLKMAFTIPGLLFIDTPGHAAFTTLRKRGGSLADIAILVVDINEGFKPQTIEAIEILKSSKTPFIIAANKIDVIGGYRKVKDSLLGDIAAQDANVQQSIETKMYELVGQLHEKFKLVAERFDRVSSYTEQVAIIPCSATQQIGMQELLMVITGLAQKYLEKTLKINATGRAKGTILEVKEEKGLGKTVDAIIYDGTLNTNDTIVIGSLNNPIVTKVRALLEPHALSDMRDKKSKFKTVKSVSAAIGVKIAAPELDSVIAGMPLVSCDPKDVEAVKADLMSEVEDILIETDGAGILIKADTIGSLEAMINILKEKKIPIRKATIGNITKKDYSEAESNYEKDPLQAVILGFSVTDEARTENKFVKVLTNNIIYKLIEDFEEWQINTKKELESKKLDVLIRPCKLEILRNCIFRQSNPCIAGVEVLIGVLKANTPLMKSNGVHITTVKALQSEGDNLTTVTKGRQVAASMPNVTAGRQIDEGDFVYSDIPEGDFRKIKKLTEYLTKDEITILKEIAEIHRKRNPVWGV
jgi:translation initiation factor 5B